MNEIGKTNLSDQTKFRLNKISKIEVVFIFLILELTLFVLSVSITLFVLSVSICCSGVYGDLDSLSNVG